MCSVRCKWVALGGNAASDHKSIVNGRVLNSCGPMRATERHSRRRYSCWCKRRYTRRVYWSLCNLRRTVLLFESSIRMSENTKLTKYKKSHLKSKVRSMPNCAFMPLLIWRCPSNPGSPMKCGRSDFAPLSANQHTIINCAMSVPPGHFRSETHTGRIISPGYPSPYNAPLDVMPDYSP